MPRRKSIKVPVPFDNLVCQRIYDKLYGLRMTATDDREFSFLSSILTGLSDSMPDGSVYAKQIDLSAARLAPYIQGAQNVMNQYARQVEAGIFVADIVATFDGMESQP
jgi:hypothetical protein